VRFCEKQLENDKTRRVLERSMGEALTMRYMTEVGADNFYFHFHFYMFILPQCAPHGGPNQPPPRF
jgi:hypothetical protein